jgi:hypothetical protein
LGNSKIIQNKKEKIKIKMQTNKNITSQMKQSFTKREKKPNFSFSFISFLKNLLPFFLPLARNFLLKKKLGSYELPWQKN